jgi:hypothetical protein
MKRKVYETFAEQKIDQRIGFIAFPIVNAAVWLAAWLLRGWVDSSSVDPTVRHPNLQLTITLLPWAVNGLLLIWALIFRPHIAGGYLVFLGGLLVVGALLALIGVVSFFLSIPLTALTGPLGILVFIVLAIAGIIWFMLKIFPVFKRWWEI